MPNPDPPDWRSIEPIRSRPVADLRSPLDLNDAMPAPQNVTLPDLDTARASIFGGIIGAVVFFLHANRDKVLDLAVTRVRLLPDPIERMLFGGFYDAVVWAVSQLQDEPEPVGSAYTGPGAAEFQG